MRRMDTMGQEGYQAVKADYADVMDLTERKPSWWDEHGVPRYCDFHPDRVANIYASEVCLLRIECQNCRRTFDVALSWSHLDEAVHKVHSLRRRVLEDRIEYGDPPNMRCCSAGPTMTSVPKQVLQFWEEPEGLACTWRRALDLERTIVCEWDGDEPDSDEEQD